MSKAEDTLLILAGFGLPILLGWLQSRKCDCGEVTEEELERSGIAALIDVIEEEGFDYALIEYSSWQEIKSEEFQTLYKRYVEARNALAEFLGVE